MKAVQIFRSKSLHIIDIEKPFLTEESNVLVRMTTAGIYGSDMGTYHGTNAVTTYSGVIGHEMVGAVGETVSFVTSLCPGDRVIVNQVTSCGHCYSCRMGRGNVYDSLAVRGVRIDGGYQEYTAVSQEDCYLLPDFISDTDAVMVESAIIIIQSCTRAEFRRDDVLLTYGRDTLGSSILKTAWLLYDYIIVAGVIDERLEGAKSAGATHTINILKEDLGEKIKEYTHGHGATASVGAVCGNDSLIRLLRATGNAGRIITMGFSTSFIEINQLLITSKKLGVRGSHLQNKIFGRATELINEGKLDLAGSVSHTSSLSKAQEAFDFVGFRDPSTRKAVLTFDFQRYTEQIIK